MRWRWTLGLIAVAIAAIVWFAAERGDDAVSERRLAAGKLYGHEGGALRSVEIAYPERSYRIEREEDGWWLTAPVRDRADPEDVEQMLAALEAQDVTRWLPPPRPEQLDAFGLASPDITEL